MMRSTSTPKPSERIDRRFGAVHQTAQIDIGRIRDILAEDVFLFRAVDVSAGPAAVEGFLLFFVVGFAPILAHGVAVKPSHIRMRLRLGWPGKRMP